MFAPVRLVLLFGVGLVFLYAGLVNPLMMMAGGNGHSPFYDRFGEEGVRAAELLLGLAATGFSAWQLRRKYRRFRQGRGPQA
jgi:hypothetical protein